MKISVIIPSYNDSRIIRTVKSILNQNFSRDKYEIIIIDGGSQKTDFKKCLEFLNKTCDLVISEPDKGIFDGLNKGLNIANGEILFMIGSDDYLINSDAFNIALSKFNEGNKMVIFELFYVNQKNKIERYWTLPKNLIKVPPYFQIPHFSTFVSKNLVGRTRFNLNSFISADFSFFKEINKKNNKVSIINTPICCMTSGGQSSKNYVNIFKGNIQSLRDLNFNPYLILRFIFHKIFTKTKHFLLLYFDKNKRKDFQDKINSSLLEFK